MTRKGIYEFPFFFILFLDKSLIKTLTHTKELIELQKVKYYKCPHCGVKYQSLQTWGNHVSSKHDGMIPDGWSYGRYFYYIQTGKKVGSCVICKNPTEWNEATLKYERFCRNSKCKEQYREMFKNRMIGKYGKVHLLDDPDQQRKMLANKHISGQYTFLDGTKVTYTGTYELDFLKFLNLLLHFNGSDIMMPSPHTYYYDYHNENDKEHEGKHFYVPDAFIPSLNLEVEIKQNTNKHPKLLLIDKVKEEQKDAMMKSRDDVNYIKIVEKEYAPFIRYIEEAKSMDPAVESVTDTDDADFVEALEEFLGEVRKAFEGYDFNEENVALESAGYSKENKNPVFIVLTSGNTPLAKIIKKATGDEFSHSSISFNENLDPLYSFGTKKIDPVHELGFIKTNPKSDLWFSDKFKVPYSVYVTFVSDDNIERMKRRLEYFVNNAADMKYSFTGLIRVFFKLKSPKKKHWFCSAFVAEILSAGKSLAKDSTLYRPQMSTSVDDIEFLISGDNISDYDPKKTSEALKNLIKESKESPALESVAFQKYSRTHVNSREKYRRLADYKIATITPMLISSYKKECRNLCHVRIDPTSFGEIVVDGNHVVGYYNTVKKDNAIWLQALEITRPYRGCELSPQLLNRCLKKAKVTNLTVNLNNELALEIYTHYGFREYARNGETIYMCYKS